MHEFKLRSITEPRLSMELSFLFLLSFPVTMVQIVHPQHTVCIQWSHGQLVKALGFDRRFDPRPCGPQCTSLLPRFTLCVSLIHNWVQCRDPHGIGKVLIIIIIIP